jgi:hypothetical protein
MQTCVSGRNALFWGTEVVKHTFDTIGPKMMFGCVSEHFPNLRHVKEAKLVFKHECTISGYQCCEASILVYWTQNCLEVFQSILITFSAKKVQNLCVGPECTISGNQCCEASILVLWTQNDVWVCFEAFH